MTNIIIPLIEDERDLLKYLESQIFENKDGKRGVFATALDLDVSHIDSRATLDGIEITCVEIQNDTVAVSYEVEYGVYNGCKDMDVSESLCYSTHGVKTLEGWMFKEIKLLPKRTTLDEF